MSKENETNVYGLLVGILGIITVLCLTALIIMRTNYESKLNNHNMLKNTYQDLRQHYSNCLDDNKLLEQENEALKLENIKLKRR